MLTFIMSMVWISVFTSYMVKWSSILAVWLGVEVRCRWEYVVKWSSILAVWLGVEVRRRAAGSILKYLC